MVISRLSVPLECDFQVPKTNFYMKAWYPRAGRKGGGLVARSGGSLCAAWPLCAAGLLARNLAGDRLALLSETYQENEEDIRSIVGGLSHLEQFERVVPANEVLYTRRRISRSFGNGREFDVTCMSAGQIRFGRWGRDPLETMETDGERRTVLYLTAVCNLEFFQGDILTRTDLRCLCI